MTITLERRRTGWDIVLGLVLVILGFMVLGNAVLATAVSRLRAKLDRDAAPMEGLHEWDCGSGGLQLYEKPEHAGAGTLRALDRHVNRGLDNP